MHPIERPPTVGDDPVAALLADLDARGWGWVDGVLSEALLTALRREALTLLTQGAFRRAGVGRGPSFRIDDSIRQDEVSWMDPANLTAAQTEMGQILHAIRERLNRRFFLGLHDFEAHLTAYPKGAHYDRHVDRFTDAGNRCVSFILYLNRRWAGADGGQLRIFDKAAPNVVAADVLPTWGRLAAFFSATVSHQVLVTGKRRLSITGWFRTPS